MTKKHLFFALLIAASVQALAAGKPAVTKAYYDGITYIIDEKTKTAVVDVNPKLDGDVVIPEQIEAGEHLYTVVGISDKAFKGGKGITSFSLPSTIRFAYRSAFTDSEWYKNEENWGEKGTLYIDSVLISVNPDSVKSKFYIPEGTTAIAVGALLDCKDIISQVWIPNTVSEIAQETFKGNTALRKFHLGRGVQRIGKDAFVGTAAYNGTWKKGVLYIDTCLIRGSKDMKPDYVVLPQSRLMADGAFEDNKVLHHIVLSPLYKEIGNETFAGCASLEYVDMSDDIERIGDYAFADCQSIKHIRLSASLCELGIQSFSGCIQLHDVKFPKGIKEIPNAAFYRCLALSDVQEWPEELKEIGQGAFRDCGQLVAVKGLPDKLKKVGEGAFAGCSSLREITLPDAVDRVDAHLCDGCIELRKVTLGDGIYDINDYAFRGCINLEAFRMPAFTFRIGKYAFLNCTSLRKTSLVDYTEVMEAGAFLNCASLEKIDIPLRLKYVDEQVFGGCKSLREINFHTKFQQINGLAFENCTLLRKVFLPEGCEVHKDAFKGAKTEIVYVSEEE